MAQEREIIEGIDVLYVGAGPSSLSSALHLSHLIKEHNQRIEKGEEKGEKIEAGIAVLEKGKTIGAHSLSGALLDPVSLGSLTPDYMEKNPPFESQVNSESTYFLTSRWKFPLLYTPPAMRSHGCYIMSLGKFVKWLGDMVEEAGVEIFPETTGWELLWDGEKVSGVRTGDGGLDKNGNPRSNYLPGSDIPAKITVLGEGARGSLTKKLVEKLNLNGPNPQIYSTGVKEIWEVPDGNFEKGRIIHTLGWPLSRDKFGGGFIYGYDKNYVALGFVIGLDYKDPFTDIHAELQRYKTHPLVNSILKGGKLIKYGAKTIPEGGLWSMPKNYGDGFLIIGDAGGFLNVMRLKGVHLAIASGIMAAETIFEALKSDNFSANVLQGFEKRFQSSSAYKELYRTRNFRQGYQKGLFRGMFHTGVQLITAGRGVTNRYSCHEDHETMKTIAQYHGSSSATPPEIKFDKELRFDKLTCVYYSGTIHEENQPCHLKLSDPSICYPKCTQDYGNPCQHFCPAHVYEMIDDGKGGKKLQINSTNCVHCKTCDVMDPYGIINWVPPEGGGGPGYQIM